MATVELKTAASRSAACDGMDITLSLSCEGLSMQASLHRLQESADQLMASLQGAGIDPGSFSLTHVDSGSSDNGQKQKVSTSLRTRGAYDPDLLQRLWQVITAASFPVELSLYFYVSASDQLEAELEKEALEAAIEKARSMADALDLHECACQSLSFDHRREQTDASGLSACPIPEEAEIVPEFLSFINQPAILFEVEASSTWQLS